MGVNLGQARDAVWVMVLPVPFMLVGFYLAFGHLLKARLEWEKLFFAATDRRLLRQKALVFSCVEHPQSLLKLLEETIQTNQQETTPQE